MHVIISFFIINLILNCSFAFNCSKTGLCHDLIDFLKKEKKKKGGKQYQAKTETVPV